MQYGLSGNPATLFEWLLLMGNRCFGDDSASNRESLPDLSRKLYRIRCPILTFMPASDRLYFLIEIMHLSVRRIKLDNKKKFKVPRPNTNISVTHRWTVTVLVLSFVLSVIFGIVTSVMMEKLELVWAFLILFIIVAVNILFDLIGTAVMNAEESPFHSLSSRRVSGASESIGIIRRAPQITSLCCDIIGDIAGIISGSATAVIAAELVVTFHWNGILPSLMLTGVVSSMTIGGKAFFKGIAMKNANSIVFSIGKFLNIFKFRRK